MKSPLLSLLTLLAIGLSFSGCETMQMARNAGSQTLESLRPTTDDYANPGDEESDPWVKEAGAEARGNRPLEKSAEPAWFTNMLRSPKARDIENNLGFE